MNLGKYKPQIENAIDWIVDLYHVLRLLKMQLFTALVSIVVFLIPGQIHEIYFVLAEDFSSKVFQAGFAVLGIVFLTFMLWYSGRWMTLSVSLNDLNQQNIRGALLKWMPRLLAIAPGIAVGSFLLFPIGNIRALFGDTGALGVRLTGAVILVLTFAFLAATIYRTKLLRPGTQDSYEADAGGFGVWPVRVAQYLPLVLVLLLLISPTGFPEFVGTLFLVTVFIGLVTFLLSWASLFSKRTGFPLTLCLIGVAVLWSVLDLNDHHDVHLEDIKTETPLRDVDKAFAAWLENRGDRSAYPQGNKYPVYIVAAEGGGIYAAHHAASFLSRIQDLCPEFARHTFAISGISGGSLGAGLFTALLSDPKNASKVASGSVKEPCRKHVSGPGHLETAADEILSGDLLSPLVAATLMQDLPHLFFPAKIWSNDRARTLENAIETAWNNYRFSGGVLNGEGLSENVLDKTVVDAWSPDAPIPALVLNTTHVETGKRVAVSPFKLTAVPTTRDYLPKGKGLSLLTGAVLSARFTYITPAGSLTGGANGQAPKARLVDGGYYENSGIDTAMDLIEAIQPIAKKNNVEIRLIALQKKSDPSEADYYLGEMLSPIRALLATRTDRGRLAKERAVARMGSLAPSGNIPVASSTATNDFSAPLRTSLIYDGDVRLPLGWMLSEQSREAIQTQVGWPRECRNEDAGFNPRGPEKVNHDNDCIMKFIQLELENGIPEVMQTAATQAD